jgi:hypothetical protein
MDQGCQMVYFQTKNPNVGKRLEGLIMGDMCILWTFDLFYGP